MSLVDKLMREHPGKNLLFTAIDNLVSEEEIRQFYLDYVAFILKDEPGITPERAETEASSELGYVLGYYGLQIAGMWKRAVPSIKFPEHLNVQLKPVTEYVVIFKADNPLVRDCVITSLRKLMDRKKPSKAAKEAATALGLESALNSVGTFDLVIDEPGSESAYGAVRLHVEERSDRQFNDGAILAFIKGYVKQIEGELTAKLGYSPTVLVEKRHT